MSKRMPGMSSVFGMQQYESDWQWS